MKENQTPKLKNAVKTHPLYKLNAFGKSFALSLGREIIYLLATRGEPRLEGNDWEEIFARCIGAKWTPSNIGLDDVSLEKHSMTWGAKTIKNHNPFDVETVRLICGRNSPDYSFSVRNVHEIPQDDLGTKILQIWNKRVEGVRTRFSNVRTVVIKGDDLSEISVYEEDTLLFIPAEYKWQWNDRGNLEGHEKNSKRHRFTWQPHGSQFTVISDVPQNRLKLRIKTPPRVRQKDVFNSIGYEDSWIEIVK